MRPSLFAALLALAFALSSASAQEPSPTPSPSPKASPSGTSSTSTSTDAHSPTSTSTEVRSPTSTSTEAHTSGNVTVTGGAGAGSTTVNIHNDAQAAQKKMTGTVKAVHADISHVELVLANGKTSGFYVNGDTTYVKGPGFSGLADLKPGTRVVVDSKMEGEKKIATSVQLTGTKKASPAAPAPKD